MLYDYTIYQIDREKCSEEDYIRYSFSRYDFLNEHNYPVKPEIYKSVYDASIELDTKDADDVLELLYTIFNTNRPDDFHGHSMSVSDIVVLNNNVYFCDSFGFIKLDNVSFK